MTVATPIPDSSLAAIKATEADVSELQAASLAQRAEMLRAACRTAMAIEQARLAAGLPPSPPAPWPASTWDFLARHAANVRSRTD
jgi:hypothetical protein